MTGTLSLIVAMDNCQLNSVRSVKRLQRLTLCTLCKEVCIHEDSLRNVLHSVAFDNTHSTYVAINLKALPDT